LLEPFKSIAIVVVVPVVAIDIQPVIISVPIGIQTNNQLCSQLINFSLLLHISIRSIKVIHHLLNVAIVFYGLIKSAIK